MSQSSGRNKERKYHTPDAQLLAALRNTEHYLSRFYALAIQSEGDIRWRLEHDAIMEARAAIAKAEAAASVQLVIEHQSDNSIRLAVDHAGKRWTVDVSADFDEDGGISAQIGRDDVLCTSAEFGWDEKHVNEGQD
jgi:hypothetical protein